MLEAFKIFGFNEKFIKWIDILNTGAVSCINYCGWLSNWFPMERGIRQGCPISPMCFILACELFACKIRQSYDIKGIKLPGTENEIYIQQYADDATLFLNNLESLNKALGIVECFSEISGLNLNKSKTEAMWLGSCENRMNPNNRLCWKTGKKKFIKI